MAVFVTGAGGFLGRTLIDALIAQGKEALAFDFASPPDDVLERWKGRAEFFHGDIRDAALIAELTAKTGNIPAPGLYSNWALPVMVHAQPNCHSPHRRLSISKAPGYVCCMLPGVPGTYYEVLSHFVTSYDILAANPL